MEVKPEEPTMFGNDEPDAYEENVVNFDSKARALGDTETRQQTTLERKQLQTLPVVPENIELGYN